MKEHFTVKKPADFILVVESLLNFFATNSNKSTDNLLIALEGDLGAGKTTFTQILAERLGVTEPVTSPTFTIMKSYPVGERGFSELVHIDAYRVESEDEVGPLHLESVISKPNTIVCIEWPQNIKNILPSEIINISISIVGEEERLVTVEYNN